MKCLIFFSFACVLMCPAAAQKAHTIYFTNGQKALEGKWSYYSNTTFPSRLTYQMEDQEWLGLLAGNNGLMGERRSVNRTSFLISIRPEGLITAWDQKGNKMMEITFHDGIANGPFKRYNREGGIREEGSFQNGMSSGPWKVYNDKGELVLSGSYTPYSEEELAERWDQSYKFLFRDFGDNTVWSLERQRIQEYMSGQAADDSARAIRHFLTAFDLADRSIVSDAKREGDFMVITTISPCIYHLHYTNDLPTGQWTYTDPNGSPTTGLTYDKEGKLMFVTDTTGKRLTPAEVATVYHQYAEDSRKERDAFWRAMSNVGRGSQESQQSAYTDAPSDDGEIFKTAEQMPQFNGDLSHYLSSKLQYPPAARDKGIQGKPTVQFVVRHDGSIAQAKIIRSSGSQLLDTEALRVVRTMPRWQSGRNHGHAVNVYFSIPITFKLN